MVANIARQSQMVTDHLTGAQQQPHLVHPRQTELEPFLGGAHKWRCCTFSLISMNPRACRQEQICFACPHMRNALFEKRRGYQYHRTDKPKIALPPIVLRLAV
jgi:hypothetical protein